MVVSVVFENASLEVVWQPVARARFRQWFLAM
jgi:hypothetical protein